MTSAVITPVRGRTTQGCGVTSPRTSCKPFYATTGKARAVCNGEPTPGKTTPAQPVGGGWRRGPARDRKSTRLNSSHGYISYAVFCLKKKKKRCCYYSMKPTVHIDQSSLRCDAFC